MRQEDRSSGPEAAIETPSRRPGAEPMELLKIHDYLWEIPRHGQMRVPGRIYASAHLLEGLRDDPALQQVANVACLPGIVGYSLAMPDIHWGYGFPIGGVAGIDAEDGVISPGGVGYDINCGVRLIRTNLQYVDVKDKVGHLADVLFATIPAGLGSSGAIPSLSVDELRRALRDGAQWAVANGCPWDVAFCLLAAQEHPATQAWIEAQV